MSRSDRSENLCKKYFVKPQSWLFPKVKFGRGY